MCWPLVGWAGGEKWGRGPMNTPAGRDGRVISGRKGQKVKGHGLVAVAARELDGTDRDGQTWKNEGNKKGDIKKKKDRREISVS